uniref:Uncharacterized protein n=1 Tax=Oryza meridionalis TaxID=40149 RepID=A0A0E0ECD1_9ORYZ
MIQPNGSSDAYIRWKLAVPSRARVPQVNMPMFLTGMSDQWHGASTFNTGSGMYQMSITEKAQPQGPSFLEMLGQGDWLFSQPTYHATTNNITLQLWIPCFVGMYTADQMIGYVGSTQSYGEPCSYEPPPITQPTQDYRHVDFSGVEVARKSVRERHSPKRLLLSGRRPPAGARRKGKKKDTSTSRNFDDDANE